MDLSQHPSQTSQMKARHFKSLLHEKLRATIGHILQVASHFPSFIAQLEYERLMAEFSKEELEKVLHSCQGKSPGPDQLPIEFFLKCYNFIGEDLPKDIKHSTTTSQILAPFNTNIIELIPKADHPSSFDQFKPISLYNSIYKTISKLIALHLKDALSENISPEQFRFLRGRPIHEAVWLNKIYTLLKWDIRKQ